MRQSSGSAEVERSDQVNRRPRRRAVRPRSELQRRGEVEVELHGHRTPSRRAAQERRTDAGEASICAASTCASTLRARRPRAWRAHARRPRGRDDHGRGELVGRAPQVRRARRCGEAGGHADELRGCVLEDAAGMQQSSRNVEVDRGDQDNTGSILLLLSEYAAGVHQRRCNVEHGDQDSKGAGSEHGYEGRG